MYTYRAIISVFYLAYAYGSSDIEEQSQQQRTPDGGFWSWMTSAGTADEDRSRRRSYVMEEQDLPDSDEIVKRRRMSQIDR